MGFIGNIHAAIESWLRIDRDGPLEAVTRARGIYVVGLTLVFTQLLNLPGLLITYGGWNKDTFICIGAAVVVLASIALVRWVKFYAGFAVFYTVLMIGAIAGSAIPDGSGVNSSLLPFLAIGPMIVGYIFDWRAALLYGLAAMTFVGGLFVIALGNDNFGYASDFGWVFQRFTQSEFAILMGTVLAIVFSTNTFQSLDKLQKSVARTKRAEEAKSEFLATMSHELRTPLNGILGLAEALSASNLSPRERALAETIRRSGESLLVIIGDLLDLSKIEAGRLELEERPFSLPDLLRHIQDNWMQAAAAKKITLRTKIYSDVPEGVLGDDHRIGQILQNLVSNAIKFTERGSVEISLSAEGDGESRRFIFCVRDTGPGIKPEVQGGIFEPFKQEDSGITRRFGGTGLGLPISRLLAELMGGELVLESSSDQGSVFRFSLPLPTAEKTAMTPRRSALAPSETLEGLHVLVAEDNEVNRMVMREFLTAWGMRFTFAEDGESALEALALDRFDLLLLDKHMPGMDGLTVAVKVRRADTAYRDIPIVIVSADAQQADIDDAMACGVDDFVAKPVRPDTLRQVLVDLVEREQQVKGEGLAG